MCPTSTVAWFANDQYWISVRPFPVTNVTASKYKSHFRHQIDMQWLLQPFRADGYNVPP